MDEKTALINLNVDENSRIITIPTVKNVFGIEGDIEVNRLTFSLPRYYSGFDMSEFSVRVNYVNANKEANYYEVDDATSDEENITFSWLMGPDVTAYAGDVKFSIKLYKKQDTKVVKVFNTKSGSGTVYAGLDVEGTVTPEEQQTLLEQIETEIKEDLNTYTEEKLSEIQNSKNEEVNSIDGTKTEIIAILDDYKTATAGYAETAKTTADNTTADRQAVADSLPDDYVTAVEKIAENTAEISAVKLTDKELTRRVDALYDIGQGITHKFETDTETAYQKAVPTGGKLMSVKSVGGKSVVWNQLVQPTSNEITGAGVKVTFSNDGIVTLNGTATTTGNAVSVQPVKNQKGHKYLMVANPLSGVYGKDQLLFSSQSYGQDSTGHGTIITNESSNAKWYYTLYVYKDVTYDNVKLQPQIFDLTQMFGSGNEPASVEEFEKMFPNDYYP